MNKALVEDIEFLIEQNNLKPVDPPRELVSEYVEERRILPPNTPFPGYWRNSKTPYSVEIMDCMSPFSPVIHVVIMKGAQTGFTAGAENVIAYYMDECPAEILYISATDKLLEKWATKRLEPLIDSCGYRHKIFAQTQSKSSRRTGDKIMTKEYFGGCLDLASAQSASGLRSDSKRILIRDEIDGAPPLLRTGEGNWLAVSEARTNAWGIRKKILDISTPTTYEASLIAPMYDEGDQRVFMVPCPHCKKAQPLVFGSETSQHGIKADTKEGRLLKAYYICDFCHEAFFNHHKTIFLLKGYWEPTATSSDETFRSYHLSSLYSPVGMFSWNELWKKYQEAQLDPDGMRAFNNLYLGLPFKESGSRPKVENVVELRGNYRSGEVPDDVLYLVCAIDVQRGSPSDKSNPARLELEILGIGAGYRTWSILYKVIEGPVLDPHDGAWEELNEWAANENGLVYKRKDGKEFPVAMVLIDSGDGNITDVVYQFTDRWKNTYPCKGFKAIKRFKGDKRDEAGPANFLRYKAKKVSEDIILYEISTNFYKTRIYNNLGIGRQVDDPQRPGFCSFPVDYGQRYFDMLTAEEKKSDGSFHCPSGRRNEALDCRVYALCAADVYLDARLHEFKAVAKNEGATAPELQMMTHRTIIELMQKETFTIRPGKR